MHEKRIAVGNKSGKQQTHVAYFAVCHTSPQSGVGKKIQDQLDAWNELGLETSLYLITQREFQECWSDVCLRGRIWSEAPFILRVFLRLIVQVKLMRSGADLVFFRDCFPYWHLNYSNRQIHVLEVNSKQGMEIKLQGKLKNFLFVLTQRNYYKSWKHFNFVTEELKNEFIEEGLCTEEDAEIFTNSINLSRIPLLPVSQNERPNLIFIGHPGLAWNGINQMMDLANCWNNATFHIVGEEKPNQVICGDNVLFHGYLKERDYQDIAKNCHLAIGTLGIQSKSMYFGCSLKTREYLALGLPVVIRYFDVDFAPSQSPFIFTLPVDNRPISSFQKEISQFLDKWRHERVSREAISAIGHIQRESKRVAYFRSLTSGLR